MARTDEGLAMSELEDSLEGQEELFRALSGYEESEPPEDSAPEEDEELLEEEAGEAPEGEPTELSIREQLRKLQERLGTEEDVSVVKSQRDKLRNELEQYRSQVEPYVQQLSQRLEQLEQTRVQSDYQRWEDEWRNYVASSPDPQTHQQRTQEFNRAREAAQQQMALYQRQQQLAQREQSLAQGDSERAQQSLIQFVTGVYEEAAKEMGLDTSKLNRDNYSALRASFKEQLEQTKRLRESPPRKVPTRPQRGGRTSAPKDVHNWFDGLIAKQDYQTIENAFRAMKEFDGMTLEDIISR